MYSIENHIDGRKLILLRASVLCNKAWHDGFRFVLHNKFLEICDIEHVKPAKMYKNPLYGPNDNREYLFDIKVVTVIINHEWANDMFAIEIE